MPNTKDQWLTTATVYDEERAALWRRVFDQPEDEPPEVPILSMVPITVRVPSHNTPQRAYQLDLNAITTHQRRRLVQEIADRFELEAATVEAQLDDYGVPILCMDVIAHSTDQGLVMGMLL